jgi:hypothetical protein
MAASGPGSSSGFPLAKAQLLRIEDEGYGLRDITGASERGAAYALCDFAKINIAGKARVGVDPESTAITKWTMNPASDPARGQAWMNHLYNTLLAICWDQHKPGDKITLIIVTKAQADGEPYGIENKSAAPRGDRCTFRKCGRLPKEGEYTVVAKKTFENTRTDDSIAEVIDWVLGSI